MLTLNATEKTGPEAVNFVRDSLDENEHELKILIDSPSQSQEITKFLTSEGFRVILEDDDGVMFLSASKKDSEIESEQEPEPESNSDIKLQDLLTEDDPKTKLQVKVMNNNVIKDSSAVILSYENKKYMPEFTAKIIASLNKSKIKPDVIVLMNNAVSLAAYNSPVCDALRELESIGVEILISDSCADRMGITEVLGAGTLADMSEIFEKIFTCEKVISL